jgi:hypothetical protein
VFQSIGVGYGAPSEGLMNRSPRKPKQPILTRFSFTTGDDRRAAWTRPTTACS